MDDLNCEGVVVDQTLRELEVINKWLGGNHVTIDGLQRLTRVRKAITQPLVIVDIGCGGGDMLKLVASWARRNKLEVDLVGVDANPNIIRYAEKITLAFPEIRYQTLDIFSAEFEALKYDVLLATLFTHHFEDDQLAQLLSRVQRQARLGVVINDLHRHWFAFYSIKMLTRLFSKSAMVRNDAAVSVLRAFLKKEWVDLMHKADIENYRIRWMWAFRWQIIID